MEEQLVTFETAKLAKEKGFDWDCRMVYKGCKEGLYLAKDKKYIYHKYKRFPYKQSSTRKNSVMSNAKIPRYTAPTQSLFQKWLREVHNINVSVRHVIEDYYICEMTFLSGKYMFKDAHRVYLYNLIDTHFKTYEEALEKGLQEALKLI